ncbi:ATP-binding protein [Algivirga pacifica]|uniref:ATP-binding protein n=1 Tax=Algivirga pacifica TaxID=1162670 RepID=A0ABP9DH06_9BACT
MADMTNNDKSIERVKGTRLQYIEVLNWGTFNQRIYRIAQNRNNTLLTGNIGAGKSTLVDAITMLLVPYQKIVFNKAAGAERQERTLKTYVEGHYGRVQGDEVEKAKAQAFRSEAPFTVLLAVFADEQRAYTVAQVFWKVGQEVKRRYVVAEKALTIREHFQDFGEQLGNLWRRLGKLEEVQTFQSFSEYQLAFRKLLSIRTSHVLDLFYQTVSMKSVGNLTAFVREQMLEGAGIASQIEELIKNYENLQRAHQQVENARKQLQLLLPVEEQGTQYLQLVEEQLQLDQLMDYIDAFFARQIIEKAQKALAEVEEQLEEQQTRLRTLEGQIESTDQQRDQIKAAIMQNGGQRLAEIRQELDKLEKERIRTAKELEKYLILSNGVLEQDFAQINESTFVQNKIRAGQRKELQQEELQQLEQQLMELQAQQREEQQQLNTESRELDSLLKRPTLIPDKMLRLRKRIAEKLALREEELPFIGELIKVKEEEVDWRGSLERLLRSFGQSMIVPERLYKQVSKTINATHLQGKLVYYKVEEFYKLPIGVQSVHPYAVIDKLEIKREDNPYADWIEHQLIRSYDYQCAANMEEFYRATHAITTQGSIKRGNSMHEKDDRTQIDDVRNYILGWSNKEKIALIQQHVEQLKKNLQQLQNRADKLQQKKRDLANNIRGLENLLQFFGDYTAIDLQPINHQQQQLKKEQEHLSAHTDKLKALEEQLQQVNQALKELRVQQTATSQTLGGLQTARQQHIAKEQEQQGILERVREQDREKYFPLLQNQVSKLQKKQEGEVRPYDVRLLLGEMGKTNRNRQRTLMSQVVGAMNQISGAYPELVAEMDVSIESIPDFIGIKKQIEKDDLPRHETRFRKELKEKTIQGLTLFNTHLGDREGKIKERIGDINQSLSGIVYDKGANTYISLNTERNPDAEIRDFMRQLKDCLSGIVGTQEENFNEERFKKVKAIIDRFKSEESKDKRWTAKVTDVRNWYHFSASEKYIADHVEKERYEDSAGKSGGQKEKLAYTILASALAYQYGLNTQEEQAQSFRFIVIDEAFGKGSNESTKYALELFQQLGLQLLIVTPLQKISVIENYIDGVHFVSKMGDESVVRDMTKKEYIEEKQAAEKSYLEKIGGKIINGR